ncbi:MAG: D-alanine--D-alanine ligase [Parcubacteria bacterium OLB19]|nr:MAG: D-alanine--D-alanine ligase [Parcubacteria bacterium OLB19]
MINERVAVLRGGPSEEYSVSMKTGRAVIDALERKNISNKDIVITKNGEWLEEGRIKTINAVLEGVDVVFLALHGGFAEDGEVQKILQNFRIPFTGSSSLSSALAFNKALTKDILSKEGILTPKYRVIHKYELQELDEITTDIAEEFGSEYIIKPTASGSSISMELIRSKFSLQEGIGRLLEQYDSIIVEEFIRGREATVAVLENFRDKELYTFPIVEIVPPRKFPFYNYEAKYSGETQIICPSNFSYTERDLLQNITEHIHKTLNLSQYSRTDFIVRDNKIYFLEVNTLPGLTNESIFPKAAKTVGLEFDNLITHLLETASN